MSVPDAVVVGSGPNGLAAAVTLARAGLEVEVYEGANEPGGGCRTAELTLRGFRHDVCSAVHPLLAISPFFQSIDLEARGVRLQRPEIAFAHPLDDGSAGVVTGSVTDTARRLGRDGRRYERLFASTVERIEVVAESVLAPLLRLPSHPLAVARFAATAVLPASWLAEGFRTPRARALLSGAAAHSMQSLGAPLTAGFGLFLTALAHVVGWPLVEGGSARIAAALVDELESLGGRGVVDHWVSDLRALPPATLVMLDLSPRGVLELAAADLPPSWRRAFEGYRFGPGVCKIDWALEGPVPWRAPECRNAGTIHLGGTVEEIAASEAAVVKGRLPERPYCIVAQPAVVDSTRAPQGRHTLWSYCHVPSGSSADMTVQVAAQIERFAPGFRDLVLAHNVTTAAEFERYDPNYVGGDINGGLASVRQTLFRPTMRFDPYRLPLKGVYLCSASTPPGGGVHGMCGYWAARCALFDLHRGRARRS